MLTKQSVTLLVLLIVSTTIDADVFRFDRSAFETRTIPGTQGIAPEQGARLNELDLRFAFLDGFDLTNATFSGSNLAYAQLQRSDLTGTLFHDVIVTGVSFSGSTGLRESQLQSTASYRARKLQTIDFAALDLTDWNFEEQNLSYSNFAQSRLASTHFNGATVSFASFYNTTATGFTKEQLYSTTSYQNGDLRGIALGGQFSVSSKPLNDLTEWDFSQQDLSGADFSNTTLSNAKFDGATIDRARFLGTTQNGFTMDQLYSTRSYQSGALQGIDLWENDLRNWNFSGQDLSGARFWDSNLDSADLSNAVVYGTRFRGSSITQEQLASTLSYRRRNLRNVGLGELDMANWSFRDQDLSGAFLQDANLEGTDFTGALVAGTSFGKGRPNVQFSGQRLNKEQLYSTASYRSGDLQGINLGGIDLNGWDFSEMNLARSGFHAGGVELSDAIVNGASIAGLDQDQLYSTQSYRDGDLTGIRLTGSNLEGWNFNEQDLTDALLIQAKLKSTDFSSANLQFVNLDGADLTDANFENANLYGAFLKNARGFSPSISTLVRNLVWPDKSIRGLEVRENETMRVPASATPGGSEISITDGMSVSSGATLELEIETFDDAWNSRLVLAPDIPVELRGTLRVNLRGGLSLGTDYLRPGWPIKLFEWGGSLNPDDQFEVLQLPPGIVWDTSQLYVTGEISVVELSEPGDLNANGQLDIDDLTMLTNALTDSAPRFGAIASAYFVSPDVRFDEEDRRYWIEELVGTSFGDTDLDGDVDFVDFLAVSANFGNTGDWGQGDFDGDGAILFPDFLLLSSNFGKTAAPRAVPEPSACAFFSMAAFLFTITRRKRRPPLVLPRSLPLLW